MTKTIFVIDTIKTFILGLIMEYIIYTGIHILVDYFGNHFVIYCWVFLIIMAIIAMLLYPTFIAPLFNKF